MTAWNKEKDAAANRKTPVVPVRLPSAHDLEVLKITAASTGMSVSAFVRDAIAAKVKEANSR